MQAARRWLFVLIFAAALIGLGPVQPIFANPPKASKDVAAQKSPAQKEAPEEQPAFALQSNLLELTGPTACPSGGCAGGQRIGMRFEFDLTGSNYDPGQDPNIKVCVYASTAWNSAPAVVDGTGETSGSTYMLPTETDQGCLQDGNPPNGYSLIAERVATLPQNTPSDALRFAFRMGTNGSGNGRVIARLFAYTASGWSTSPAASANSAILSMANPAIANPVYVANDGQACGVYSPCYINSYGDQERGTGTGLKDAIDALPTQSTIFVIGSYTVKTNTVLVDKKLTLSGVNDATITYTGSSGGNSCSFGMLALDETVTIRGLNIDDGNCAGTNRNLVEINSRTGRTENSDVVVIESNDMSSGDNAIFVRADNTDRIIVRFNQISGNVGYAAYFEGSGSSPAEVMANNIYGNRTNSPSTPPVEIECAANGTAPVASRKANHNYWGTAAPGQDVTHCMIAPAKRLGMPIAHHSNSPGVNADKVLVTTTKNYATRFDNQLAYNRTGGSDFDLYIVDHGYMTSGGPPFSQTGESVSPCSNYWDVFIADGAPMPSSLDLYVKYYNKENKTPGCLAVINSTQYCDQSTTPGKYPLYWLDPSSNSATTWWDPVGARPENLSSGDGQSTGCNISANEIRVSIDASGRPALSDLGYTPFMVGIPVIKSFKPLASSQTVTVTWATNNEPDISGFYVLRGTDANSLTPLNGDIIPRQGNSNQGMNYSRIDSNRVNGTTYYYRLQVVRTDGYSFYSAIVPVTVNAATPTSPPPTWTASPIRPSNTPPFTPVPTNRPTSIPTRTLTPFRTWTPSPTFLDLPTLTSTVDLSLPGAYDTLTAIAVESQFNEFDGTGTPPAGYGTPEPDLSQTSGTGTPIAMLGSTTPNPLSSPTITGVVEGESTTANPWISLLLGILAGLVVVGGVGRWWYSTQK